MLNVMFTAILDGLTEGSENGLKYPGTKRVKSWACQTVGSDTSLVDTVLEYECHTLCK